MTRGRNDDKRAWDDLAERYAPLVWSICRRHELSDADAADVNQSVWLQLMSQLDQIGDPAALPGWVATATRPECVRVRRAAPGPHAAGYLPDAQAIPDRHAEMAEQELLTAERHAALRGALARLPPRCQQLIGTLIEDPPVPDAQISAPLSIPVGSIAPRPARRGEAALCRRAPGRLGRVPGPPRHVARETPIEMTAQTDDELWSAIADPSRRRVLDLVISYGEVSASWLAGRVPFSRQAVSKHMVVLERAGLVRRRKQGREVLYQVQAGRLDQATRAMAQLGARWGQRLGTIKQLAEAAHAEDKRNRHDR